MNFLLFIVCHATVAPAHDATPRASARPMLTEPPFSRRSERRPFGYAGRWSERRAGARGGGRTPHDPPGRRRNATTPRRETPLRDATARRPRDPETPPRATATSPRPPVALPRFRVPIDRSGAPHWLEAKKNETFYEAWVASGGNDLEWSKMDPYERAWAKVVAGSTAGRPVVEGAAARRVFVVVAVQRTGSTWLVRELDRHPCLRVGAELFLDVKSDSARRRAFAWTGAAQFSAIAGLVDGRVGEDAEISAVAPVGGRYDRLRRRCARAVAATRTLPNGPATSSSATTLDGSQGTTCGFKWMVSQRFERYWTEWFGRACAEYDVGLVFLTRENPLRVVASMADKKRGQDSQRVSKSKNLTLWTGAELVRRLDKISDEYEAMRRIRENATARGVRTMATTYETNVAAPEAGLDAIATFALGGGGGCEKNHRGDASTFSFAAESKKRRSRRSVKVHPQPMSQFVANWEDVVDTLRGTRYEDHIVQDAREVAAARGVG